MIRIRKLERDEWHSYWGGVSRLITGKWAEIDVASLDLGYQTEVRRLPLIGISYDPKDDLFDVALEGLDHLVPHPRECYVEEGPEGLMSIEIVDAEGVQRIIILSEPLMLPPYAEYRAGF